MLPSDTYIHTMACMGVSVESLGIEGACFFYSLQFTLPAAITAEMLQLDLEDHLYIPLS